MIRRVYKYALERTTEEQTVAIPHGGIIRHVAMQNGEICLWVEVEIYQGHDHRRFAIHGTGHDIPEGEVWRGTVFDGPFVWHVYEVERS